VAKTHTLWRYGGNANHHWRRLFTGTYDECMGKFVFAEAALRQGAVMVLPIDVDPATWPSDGSIPVASQIAPHKWEQRPAYTWAPRLRTRW